MSDADMDEQAGFARCSTNHAGRTYAELALRPRAGNGCAGLAEAGYEAVRGLNHATLLAQCGLRGHEDLYRVVGSLAALLHATPQALRQAAAWLAREQQDGRVSADSAAGAGPAELTAAIEAALADAAAHIGRAARRVDAAHQATSHLIIDPARRPGM